MNNKVNYLEYLNSLEWKLKREKTFKLKGRKCQRCVNNIKLHIHHATYARLGKENIQRDLYVLCDTCHDEYHKTTDVISIPTTRAFINDAKNKTKKFSELKIKRNKKSKKHYIKNLGKVIREAKNERKMNLDRMFRKGLIKEKEYLEKIANF